MQQMKKNNDGRIVHATMQRQGVTMETDVEEFAMALKTYRLRQGLTQAQLGAKWGLSRYTILRAETCKRVNWTTTYRLFNKLAAELRKEESSESV